MNRSVSQKAKSIAVIEVFEIFVDQKTTLVEKFKNSLVLLVQNQTN